MEPSAGPGPGRHVAEDLDRLAAAQGALDGVEAAMARIDAGSYGRCQACGAPMGEARLDVDPLALRCGGPGCAAG